MRRLCSVFQTFPPLPLEHRSVDGSCCRADPDFYGEASFVAPRGHREPRSRRERPCASPDHQAQTSKKPAVLRVPHTDCVRYHGRRNRPQALVRSAAGGGRDDSSPGCEVRGCGRGNRTSGGSRARRTQARRSIGRRGILSDQLQRPDGCLGHLCLETRVAGDYGKRGGPAK